MNSRKTRDKNTHDLGSLSFLFEGKEADRRRTRLGITTAVLAHVVLFAINWPTIVRSAPEDELPERRRYEVKELKYEIPPTPPPEMAWQRPVELIQVPDPDPESDEPVRQEATIIPELDPSSLVPSIGLPIPPEPDPPPPEIIRVGGDIKPPRVLHRVQPIYVEAARRIRLEGAVVLSLLIDESGDVASIEVLNSLPLGLTDSAVTAVRQWVFEPSTLNGHPVKIEYVLTIRFDLL